MTFSAIALLVAGLLPSFPSAPQSDAVRHIRIQYELLRDEAYNHGQFSRIETLYRQACTAVLNADIEECARKYWLSRVEYMMGRACQSREDLQEAARHYEEGLELSKASMRDGEFSEGWRMMSENLGQLCVVKWELSKSLGFLIAHGPKVKDYAARAAELDPRNAAALIILAAGKIYPPVIFGGNPRKGIEMMNDILVLGSAEKDDLFNIYSGIALAHGKLNNKQEAVLWFQRSLELYPNNRYIREEYQKILD
jgi:tetratricopeptide (TPR) repeat protein